MTKCPTVWCSMVCGVLWLPDLLIEAVWLWDREMLEVLGEGETI